jgi:hypothetical protein
MLTALCAYAALASAVSGCAWYSMLCFYALGLAAFWLWHAQAHHKLAWVPFNTKCFEYHSKHHWVTYPPKYFFGSPEHKKAVADADAIMSDWKGGMPGRTPWQHEALLYFFTVSILVGAKFLAGVNNGTLAFVAFGYLLMGSIGGYLHNSFHVIGHPLSEYEWYKELRALHYVHHLGTAKHNYAVLNFALDKMLATYVLDNPTPKAGSSIEKRKTAAALMENEDITNEHVRKALTSSPLSHALLAFAPVSTGRSVKTGTLNRGFSAVFVRVLWIIAALALWNISEEFVTSITNSMALRQPAVVDPNIIIDRGHEALAPINAVLQEYGALADSLIIFSSISVDIAALFILGASIFGTSITSMAGAIIFLIVRQFCELVVLLPVPSGCSWHRPELQFPSLFVSYDGGHQFFFSAHIGLFTIAVRELLRLSKGRVAWQRIFIAVAGLLFIGAQAGVLVSLRAHWTVDVVVGFVVALLSSLLADKYASWMDAFMP